MSKAETAVCEICGQTKSTRNGTIGEVVRPSLSDFIKKKAPQWDGKGFICYDDLGKFRRDYVKEVLQDEIGELSALATKSSKAWHKTKFFPTTSASSSR